MTDPATVDFGKGVASVLANYKDARLKSISRAEGNLQNVAAGGPLLFGQGDSWFDFPNVIEFNAESDVLDSLLHHYGYVVERMSRAGATVEQMRQEDQLAELRRNLLLCRPRAFLFSGGGNDIVGFDRNQNSDFGEILNPKGSTSVLNYLRYDFSLAPVISGITQILSVATSLGVHSFLHGYDYAIPSGKTPLQTPWGKPFIGPGPWLRPVIVSHGYEPDTDGREIIKLFIDYFNQALVKLANELGELVHYVKIPGTITQDSDWHDELHLWPPGWRLVAGKFDTAIKELPEPHAKGRMKSRRSSGRR